MADPSGIARIATAFAAARSEGRAALMPYMMGGYPTLGASREVAEAYIDSGADLIELGVPYSDPLADGPVIHEAATVSLQAGVTLDHVLEICSGIADRIPVVLMIYANMVLAQGEELFAVRAANSGAAGVIVPDLPVEESGALREQLSERGIALIPLIAPTTPAERRATICAQAEGFVYVVSLAGVTGERSELPPELADLVHAVQSDAEVPAAVGFGIGTPEQAARVGALADGVIIGSRLVRMADPSGDGGAAEITEFLGAVRSSLAR